jgi:asparagine synthase (glutamine-hydrolysing)
MCGIAGAFFWRDTAEARRAREIVSTMTAAERHRGPDGSGLIVSEAPGVTCALGHRRLAIIDLSDRAAQPMKSASAPIWVTFNGEIYNFADVRRDLEAEGRRFTSQSDTEVILQGYETWGEAVIDRLRGMFAFAIYDGVARRLLLARDRLGVKPLYVFAGTGLLLFASEVRSLLASGIVPRRLDPIALDHYLAYQTAPTPRTLVAGVRLLSPGHRLMIDDAGQPTERRYWDFFGRANAPGADTTEAATRERVHALLRQAVAGHLVSDVPVGVFLSGGIDSTAIVALVREGGLEPRTFSVVLPGTAHDEAPYSRLVAERFACRHEEIVMTEGELTASIPTALDCVDHPSGDGINTFVVSRAVRQAGIKVALSGLGGDELFGGYPSFGRLRRLRTYARVWRQSPTVVRAAAAAAVRSMGGVSVATEKTAAVLESDGSSSQLFPILRQIFGRAERASLLGRRPTDGAEDEYVRLLADAAAEHPDRDLMSFVSFAESRTYMHDVLLRDSDQMSMAHGLELRVPFLDHPLVEYVVDLPERLKAPGVTPKRLLVESVGAAMPLDVVRRTKRGFVLPFDAWMKGELRALCAHHLGPDGLGRLGLIRREPVEALWRSFLADDGRTTWSRPWTLVAFDAWRERNGISA